MNKKNVVTLLTLMLMAIEPAMADQSQIANTNSPAPTREEIISAISLLLRVGVLDINRQNTELVLREPTILQKLESMGRVNGGGLDLRHVVDRVSS